jgi:hypothetical protein
MEGGSLSKEDLGLLMAGISTEVAKKKTKQTQVREIVT